MFWCKTKETHHNKYHHMLSSEYIELPRDTNTLQPLYNTIRYNTVLDITRFNDGSQKCIDYIEK